VKRREFITLLGSVGAWPIAGAAQQGIPTIGYLSTQSPEAFSSYVTAFRRGLKETGHAEGQNVQIEYRWAGVEYDRLPAMADDLVRRKVAVIAAFTNVAVLAARAATTTIPIVFSIGSDPVTLGIVSSLNQPGGNVTGIQFFGSALVSKRIELLNELVPKADSIGMLLNPVNPDSDAQLQEARAAAQTFGKSIVQLEEANTEADLAEAFAQIRPRRIQALVVQTDSLFTSRPALLAGLAASHKVPAMYPDRAQVIAGGLSGYGASIAEAFRQVGTYTGRILRGERPGDLPVHSRPKSI